MLINKDIHRFRVSVLHPAAHALHVCGSLTSFILFPNSSCQGVLKHVKVSIHVGDAQFHPFYFLDDSENHWVDAPE